MSLAQENDRLRREYGILKEERDILKKAEAVDRHWSEDNGRTCSSRAKSREVRVIGWAVSNRMTRTLATRALNMAIAFRQPPKSCIHHTDRGSQYCSHDYQKILRQHGFSVSMSGKGKCYDNAAVETFFKTLKAELIWRRTWDTRRQAEMAVFEYINGFYNPRRRHSALGRKSPVTIERKMA
jgi:transposase InsO family protein